MLCRRSRLKHCRKRNLPERWWLVSIRSVHDVLKPARVQNQHRLQSTSSTRSTRSTPSIIKNRNPETLPAQHQRASMALNTQLSTINTSDCTTAHQATSDIPYQAKNLSKTP
jgi:hypothetical protein